MQTVLKTTIGLFARSKSIFLVPVVALCVSQSCYATLTFYSDRTAFALANQGLSIEDFEDGLVWRNFSSPLDSTSDNDAFNPGDILPGVAFSNSDPAASINDLILVDGSGVTPLPSKALSKALDSLGVAFGSGLDIAFAGDKVFAVGLEVFLDDSTGNLSSAETKVSIFGSVGMLDTVTLFTSDSGPVFFGVSSDRDPIKRINVDGVVPGHFSFEIIDNLNFVSSIPESSTLILTLCGVLMLGVSTIARRRESGVTMCR